MISPEFPKYYSVEGAGSSEVNGLYVHSGTTNGKPYYTKQTTPTSTSTTTPTTTSTSTTSTPTTSTPVLWYFYSTTYFLYGYNGWYISKELSTSSLSANDDYYSAYIHSPLPPATGWVARTSGYTVLSGCGRNPPPKVTAYDQPEDTPSPGLLLPDHPRSFPFLFSISGAGTLLVNGLYEYVSFFNNRPYYRKQSVADGPVLWYFYSTLHRSLIGFNGWYVSRSIGTSAISAGSDYYTAYNHGSLPPEGGWVPREPGLGPTAGIGIGPAPMVVAKEGISVFQVKVQTPDNKIIYVDCKSSDNVETLKLKIQDITDLPLYSQQLIFSERLSDDSPLSQYSLGHGDTLVVNSLPNPVPPPDPPKCIVVVGAGPVGLWVAIQVRIHAPTWRTVCFERRMEYGRQHALRIDGYAFEGMADTADLRDVRDEFQPRTRTATVESRLKAIAEQRGVELRYENVESLRSVISAVPGVTAVVGCDGARSLCRREVGAAAEAPGEFRENETLGSLLQIKFDARGEVGRASGALQQFLQNLPARQQFFNILPAKFDLERNITPITIFTLISDEIFRELKGTCDSGHPCASVDVFENFTESSLKPQFSRVATDISAILQNQFPEGIVPESLRISVLPAAYHVASAVVATVEGVPVFLAGDAALGLPLEKGLNYGWNISSHLVQHLCFAKNFVSAQKGYMTFFHKRADSAISHVKKDYLSYVGIVQKAGWVRSWVKIVL